VLLIHTENIATEGRHKTDHFLHVLHACVKQVCLQHYGISSASSPNNFEK